MIAITTSSSIRVNADRTGRLRKAVSLLPSRSAFGLMRFLNSSTRTFRLLWHPPPAGWPTPPRQGNVCVNPVQGTRTLKNNVDPFTFVVKGEVAPVMSTKVPEALVERWSTPTGQVTTTLLPEGAMLSEVVFR